MTTTIVYWGTLCAQNWTLYLAATKNGLCCVTLPNESFDTLVGWVSSHIPAAELVHDESRMKPYGQQLSEYFRRTRSQFSLPLDFHGTPFQQSVWTELTKVGYGETVSYSDLASRVGRPRAVRAVGTANAVNPLPFLVPCHRVIGKNGALTGYRGGLNLKQQLLLMEGALT